MGSRDELVQAYLDLALAFCEMGQHDDALQQVEKIEQLAPSVEERLSASVTIATCHRLRQRPGDLGKAMELVLEVLRESVAGRPDAWYELGRIAEEMGDIERAAASYAKAQALDPWHAEARARLHHLAERLPRTRRSRN